jgi:nitrite reductase/ring-hydroxylating ferredoxin subunit
MPAATQRVFAGAREKVLEGGRLVIDVGETTIGLFRVGGKLYAYLNKCAHQGGPVCQGMLEATFKAVNAETQLM